jgi:hypothetical protein
MSSFFLEDQLPRGSGTLLTAFSVLLSALVMSQSGHNERPWYHQLVTIHARVSEVMESRNGMHVWVDTTPDAVPHHSALLSSPGLRGAYARLSALPAGERIEADFDPFNGQVWRLVRADGGPGYGSAEISRWRIEDQAHGRRVGLMLAAVGAVLLVIGIVRVGRETDVIPLPRFRDRRP